MKYPTGQKGPLEAVLQLLRRGVVLAAEEAQHAVDHARILEPGPVAGAGEDLGLGVAERLRVAVREARRQVAVVFPPEHERRALDAMQVAPGGRESVRVGVAVELQD